MKQLFYIICTINLFYCFACSDILDVNPRNSVTFSNAMQTEREIEIGLGSVEKRIREYTQDQYRMKPGRWPK